MITASGLKTDVDSMLRNGQQIRVQYFTQTIGSVYDDDVTFASSGTQLYTSGLLFPVKATEGSTEALLIQQGKLKTEDQILYINGNIDINFKAMRIGLGSPLTNAGSEFHVIEDGVHTWKVGGDDVYHKLFIRRLTGGSF